MNSELELLALRKDVLLARSAFLRLKAGGELDALRESLRWPRLFVAIALSPKGSSLLFGLLWMLAGRSHLARLVRGVAAIVAVAKVAGLLARPTGHPEPTSAASSHSPDATS